METKAKKGYSEILKTLKKYKDVCVFDVEYLEGIAKNHLFGIELKEKYGFDINPKMINSLDYINLGSYIYLYWVGKRHFRTISWSDDGTQPENELLLVISFSTGAYIFGDDYPTDLFQKLFLELKSFNPKYVDSTNNALYFSMDNAGNIFNNFKNIMKKYDDLNKEDLKLRRIKKIKEELAKLETSK